MKMTKELAELVGMIYGDGCLSSYKIEKENTQNCQIKSFGFVHESLLRSFA